MLQGGGGGRRGERKEKAREEKSKLSTPPPRRPQRPRGGDRRSSLRGSPCLSLSQREKERERVFDIDPVVHISDKFGVGIDRVFLSYISNNMNNMNIYIYIGMWWSRKLNYDISIVLC